MDDATRQRLNDINREFYRRSAADFDATRQRAWAGWERLLQHLSLPVGSLLDIGCGNSRFARFLAEKQACGFHYIGIDNCPQLLSLAAQQLRRLPQLEVELLEWDLVMRGLPDARAQLVTAFGLLHHVPGAAARQALLRGMADAVLPGGRLAFTTWRFMEEPRLAQRVRPWGADIATEAQDYLLDWRRGQPALRYCHYVDDQEHAALVAATGMQVIADYRADGASKRLNRYSILRKPAP